MTTVTVDLTPRMIEALNAMVDLGVEDRAEFLGRYAAENDYTDEDIASGQEDITQAREAMERINNAASQSD
ncbi:hypothetical protein [Marinobacter subterrani]|uniref:hypothetical protein n=1 Tax=Marinobacter subterrani TaxID=1658765 RepID=UPI0023548988|nr:hypothetical protein [Marinobacter subterrani]